MVDDVGGISADEGGAVEEDVSEMDDEWGNVVDDECAEELVCIVELADFAEAAGLVDFAETAELAGSSEFGE